MALAVALQQAQISPFTVGCVYCCEEEQESFPLFGETLRSSLVSLILSLTLSRVTLYVATADRSADRDRQRDEPASPPSNLWVRKTIEKATPLRLIKRKWRCVQADANQIGKLESV